MSKPTTHALPEGFIDRLEQIAGPFFRDFEKTFTDRPTTLRINRLKLRNNEIEKLGNAEIRDDLSRQGFKLQQVPWYKDAFILLNKSKRELTETDVYKEGKIYIQSLASMVPPLVLDPKPGEKVLDLTAAPGSKTSQIAALMQREGELVANDNNRPRFFKLKHNMEMLGVADMGAAGDEGEDHGWKFSLRLEHGWKLCSEYPAYFDKILLDAPCSAEARFISGDPRTYGYWSERKIKEMAYKQRQLLLSAWGALKPGGVLVYSTCTLAPEENEVQISRLLDRHPDEASILPIKLPGVKILPPLQEWKDKKFPPEVRQALRLCPNQEIEGFFIAKIQKRATPYDNNHETKSQA